MLTKLSKIILKTGGNYFLFIFISLFLSLFSYIFADSLVVSVRNFIGENTKPFVWGDIVVTSNFSLDDEYIQKTYQNDFHIAHTVSTHTALEDPFQPEKPQLVELVYYKNYPLYNHVVFDQEDPNGIFVSEEIQNIYGKSMTLFWENLSITGLVATPAIGDISLYDQEKTIYIPLEYFPQHLTTDNSRLSLTYYFVAKNGYTPDMEEQFRNDEYFKQARIQTLDGRSGLLANTIDRLTIFLHVFHFIIFSLTFFIVVLSLETFFTRLRGIFWLLHILWLTKKRIFLLSSSIVALLCSLAYLCAGWASFLGLSWVSEYYDMLHFHALSMQNGGLITLVLFATGFWAPMYKILQTGASELVKADQHFSHFSAKDYAIYAGLLWIGFLCIEYISGIGFFMSLALSSSFLVFLVGIYWIVSKILSFVVRVYAQSRHAKRNFYIFDSIRSTVKPGNVSFFVIFSTLVSFLSLFIFFVFSGSFIAYLENIIQNENDTFVRNLTSTDIPKAKKYFSDEEIYEIVMMRIDAVNGHPLKDWVGQYPVPQNFSREFFSTTKLLDNKILSGNTLKSGWVSVDRDFARELGVKIGDEILFNVAGLQIALKVVNMREAVRNGTNPFFFFQVYAPDFENYPKNALVVYDSKQKDPNLEAILVQELWGHVSFIKIGAVLETLIEISSKILFVVYVYLAYIAVFAFLWCGVCLWFLANFKIFKLKLVHTLWGIPSSLLKAINIEFFSLIFLAKILAIVSGTLILTLLFSFIPFFSFHIPSFWTAIGVVAGLCLLLFCLVWLRNKNLKKYF